MSKKLFTFIQKGQIHLEPQTKIIPAESVSIALEAQEVLSKIKDDAKNYRQTVVEEIEEIKAKAQKDGYEAGFAAWAEHIAQLEEEITKVRKDYEKILVPAALKGAQKLLGREIENNELAILDIVANSLKSVSTHKKITLYVSPKERGVVEANKNRLKELFEQLEAFQIRERADIQPGGVVIETEGGIINAELSNQWEILERAFEHIFKKKSELTK